MLELCLRFFVLYFVTLTIEKKKNNSKKYSSKFHADVNPFGHFNLGKYVLLRKKYHA